MKADPFAQRKLLDLRALDSEADQLRHRRAHLAEDAAIADLSARRAELDGRARDQQIAVDDLTAAQAKADADVEQVKARRKRDRDRMDQGLIANPKDLERMQHELETLERRIAALEDEELEVMEQLEEAQAALTALRSELTEVEEQLAALTKSRDLHRAEIDRELERVTGQRAPVAAEVPDDLLALYDRLRANKGGVGAAELRARRCNGCMLDIDNAELAQIRTRPEDEVLRCEECQQILVRTGESGL